jgi:hypothetical protein
MKKFIVTTTINRPTDALIRYSQIEGWTLIVVGDKKTPREYNNLDCIYLDPASQESISKELSDLIGWNCIQRRNFGFLYALRNGADLVASVDDDNIPFDDWGRNIIVGQQVNAREYAPNAEGVFDPISVTEYPHLWHRGYPLQFLNDRTPKYLGDKLLVADIQASFWNGDPDIDAICRMEHSPNCEFLPSSFPFFSGGLSPFNSQNTIISREALKQYFMFPNIGRMDDIWAAYYLESLGYRVVYTEATVLQSRNIHDLTLDFEREVLGYTQNHNLIRDLKRDSNAIQNYLPEKTYVAFELYRKLAQMADN